MTKNEKKEKVISLKSFVEKETKRDGDWDYWKRMLKGTEKEIKKKKSA